VGAQVVLQILDPDGLGARHDLMVATRSYLVNGPLPQARSRARPAVGAAYRPARRFDQSSTGICS
jgi:hypothetical protein